MFRLKHKINAILVQPSDTYAIIQYKNGATEKRELFYDTSFLSQSARFIALDEYVSNVSIFNNKREKRMLPFDKNPH